LQPIASQPQAPVLTSKKKSYLKTYGRFFVFSPLCHNRAMIDEKILESSSRRNRKTRKSKGEMKRNGGESKTSSEATEAYQFRLIPLNSG
jgi:hypothetical protein